MYVRSIFKIIFKSINNHSNDIKLLLSTILGSSGMIELLNWHEHKRDIKRNHLDEKENQKRINLDKDHKYIRLEAKDLDKLMHRLYKADKIDNTPEYLNKIKKRFNLKTHSILIEQNASKINTSFNKYEQDYIKFIARIESHKYILNDFIIWCSRLKINHTDLNYLKTQVSKEYLIIFDKNKDILKRINHKNSMKRCYTIYEIMRGKTYKGDNKND